MSKNMETKIIKIAGLDCHLIREPNGTTRIVFNEMKNRHSIADKVEQEIENVFNLKQFILDKLVWASPHRNCIAGAHGNSIQSGSTRYRLDCPTERMFKLWYTTLIESKVLTQEQIEKYLEEKKKNK